MGAAAALLEEFVDKAADLGFNGVMLGAKRPHLSVLDWNACRRRELRARIEARGLTSVCVAGYTNFTADLEHGDIPHREIQIRHVLDLAEMAHDLGGSLVRVFTGYENAAATPHAQWKILVEALRECARRSADLGVTIGVQNHHDVACGFESLDDLIREVNEPNCQAMFDAWAPALHGVDIVEAARRLAPRTVHTTIANYQLRPRYRYAPALVNYEKLTPSVQAVPMDEGFIDYRAFLAALKRAGLPGRSHTKCARRCSAEALREPRLLRAQVPGVHGRLQPVVSIVNARVAIFQPSAVLNSVTVSTPQWLNLPSRRNSYSPQSCAIRPRIDTLGLPRKRSSNRRLRGRNALHPTIEFNGARRRVPPDRIEPGVWQHRGPDHGLVVRGHPVEGLLHDGNDVALIGGLGEQRRNGEKESDRSHRSIMHGYLRGAHGATLTQSSGFTGRPLAYNAQCRCGALDRPVDPT